MAFTYESFLVNFLFPYMMILGLLLIFPLPRFIKKAVFWCVEITIPQISNMKVGYIFWMIWLIVMAGNYISYSNFVFSSQEVPGQGFILEKDCTDIRHCNLNANSATRQFRNVLIHAFGFTISIMNFVLTNKQKEVYALQDKK